MIYFDDNEMFYIILPLLQSVWTLFIDFWPNTKLDFMFIIFQQNILIAQMQLYLNNKIQT